MSVRKTLFIVALLFAALVSLADGYILPTLHTSTTTQGQRTITCEIRKTDEGWKINPVKGYLNDDYWKNVCHADKTVNDKEEAIHALEMAGWKMIAPSPSDGNAIRFSKIVYYTELSNEIDRMVEFTNRGNPEHK